MKKINSGLVVATMMCSLTMGAQAKPEKHIKASSVQSRLGSYYCNEGVDNEGYPYAWYITLKTNGMFVLWPPSAVEGSSQGSFTIKGEVITFKFPGQRINGRMYGQGKMLGRFKGNAIITQLDTENDDDESPHYHKYVRIKKRIH